MRNVYKYDNNTTLFFGTDPMGVHGKFFQVTDNRYEDEEGESYLLDFDTVLGFTCNLIGATIEELKKETCVDYIKKKVDAFILSRKK
jgi:hypothetical protein